MAFKHRKQAPAAALYSRLKWEYTFQFCDSIHRGELCLGNELYSGSSWERQLPSHKTAALRERRLPKSLLPRPLKPEQARRPRTKRPRCARNLTIWTRWTRAWIRAQIFMNTPVAHGAKTIPFLLTRRAGDASMNWRSTIASTCTTFWKRRPPRVPSVVR